MVYGIIGAGNSGLAMSAHFTYIGEKVILWNRTKSNIEKLLNTRTINLSGVIDAEVQLYGVTDSLELLCEKSDILLVTTPADSHKDIARQLALFTKKDLKVILNPGRTFGALEFEDVFNKNTTLYKIIVAETQTIIYTCRKLSETDVIIYSFKKDTLIACKDKNQLKNVVSMLPEKILDMLKLSDSLIETSLGNVGQILHCAPMLLNIGWTEYKDATHKYYYEGISPTIAKYITNIDNERLQIAESLGYKLENIVEWMNRVYQLNEPDLYSAIQSNSAYDYIDAPRSLEHRYIYEDIPCGLVPLESIGKMLNISTPYTTTIVDLAILITGVDFRQLGRKINDFIEDVTLLLK